MKRLPILLLALAGTVVTALFLHGVAARLPYPHELSKMEGGFADHARWAAEGRPLYAAPSAEFVPFLYMPLAHQAAGALVRLGLDGFTATRLVSLAGIALALAVGMTLVVRATGRRALALLVPALAFARYFDVECFYDQARPDDLMAGFCMVAVAALALPSPRAAVALFVASALLAFFTKQSSALFLALVLAGAACVRWRVALVAGLLLAATAAPLFLWLDAHSGGWMKRYTFDIAAYHTVDRKGLLALVRSEFLNHFALVTAAAAIAAVVTLGVLRTRWRRREPAVPLDGAALARHLLLVGTLAAAAFALASSTQRLAVRNVFVLYALAAAAWLPVALDGFQRWCAPRHAWRHGGAALLLLLALDVGRGARDPRPWTPRAEDVATWRRLLDECARFGPPERTWVMLHGAAWGGRAGDPFHLHFGALSDLVGGYYGAPTGVEVPPDLRARVEQRWYSSIVVAGWDPRLDELLDLDANYVRAPDVAPIRLPMFSGYGAGLSEVWIPRSATPAR